MKINTRFRRSVYQAGEHTFTRESVGTRYVPAFVHSVNHLTARRRADTSPAYGCVWTACFRQIDGVWLVVHDHVSVPADLDHGQAVLNLTPELLDPF